MDLPRVLRERLLVHEGAALGPLTTLGVGGPAPFVIEPRTRQELMLAVRELRAAGLPFRLLGHGSNLLVRDEGVPDVVLHTRQMTGIWHHGEVEHALRVEAGASLARLVSVCQQQGLAGVEALVGIPGTLGGAVAGNAGGRHGAIGDVLAAVTLLDERGEAHEQPCTPAQFGYRNSPFKGRVVLDAVLQLRPDAPAAVQERVSRILHDKRESQPLAARSAGCMFRNPAGASSGQLIERAGCMGLAVGPARVSGRHANFVLNEGGARAADVLALLERVRCAVRASSGHELQLEVEVWGADGGDAIVPATDARRRGDVGATRSGTPRGLAQETSRSTARGA
jgi:UDP-N-acetylmuramate dehydrogenase